MNLAVRGVVSAAVALSLGVVGFSSIASADMDVLVKPGETKTVYVSKPQRVNVACMGLPDNPPSPMVFEMAQGSTTSFCTDTASVLNALTPENPEQGISGVSATCDLQSSRVSAKFMGIRVGAETRLIARYRSANCITLSWMVSAMQTLKSPDAIVHFTYHCEANDPEIWVKASVSRFQ